MLQHREAALDSGRAEHITPAVAALIHAFIIKLIAAATCWPATHQQANCKAISKSAAECSEGRRSTARAEAFLSSRS